MDETTGILRGDPTKVFRVYVLLSRGDHVERASYRGTMSTYSKELVILGDVFRVGLGTIYAYSKYMTGTKVLVRRDVAIYGVGTFAIGHRYVIVV